MSRGRPTRPPPTITEPETPASALSQGKINEQIARIDIFQADPKSAFEDPAELARFLAQVKYSLLDLVDRHQESDQEDLISLTPASLTSDLLENYAHIVNNGYNAPGRAANLLRRERPALLKLQKLETNERVEATGNEERHEIRELARQAIKLGDANFWSAPDIYYDFVWSLQPDADKDSRKGSRPASRSSGKTRFESRPHTPPPVASTSAEPTPIAAPAPKRKIDTTLPAIPQPAFKRPLTSEELVDKLLDEDIIPDGETSGPPRVASELFRLLPQTEQQRLITLARSRAPGITKQEVSEAWEAGILE